ncbi:amino acid ABC transporter permease [Ramlibacter sp.]|uniref:amino acid ABC transporter permease n=1 Tax=Ramlibacter sp. TaxID=1917967 RepID=UPI003D148FC7
MLDFAFLSLPATLGTGESNLALVFDGWRRTLAAFAGAMTLALVVGLPLGVVRTLPRARIAQRAIAAYVEVVRNVPLLVQLFLWFFVLPEILPRAAGDWLKRDLPDAPYWTLVVGLGVFMSVRVIELTRAGVGSLGRGQREACFALGLHARDEYRFVLLPQALRIVLPPFTTEFTNCIKGTSVGLTIGYIEVTQRAREISEQTFRTFEIFFIATLVYLVTILTVVVVLQALEHALRLPGTLQPPAA